MNNINMPSNRSFGIVFFVVFVIVSLYPLIYDQNIRIWSLVVSFIFLFLGIINSILLIPLNSLWFKLGLFLGKYIAPIIMGIVYFAIVFPTFLSLKFFKKNYLNIKYERNKNSYWLSTKDKNTTMKDQF